MFVRFSIPNNAAWTSRKYRFRDRTTGVYRDFTDVTLQADVEPQAGGSAVFSLTTENGGIVLLQDTTSWYLRYHVTQANAALLTVGVIYVHDLLSKSGAADPERIWRGEIRLLEGPTEWVA